MSKKPAKPARRVTHSGEVRRRLDEFERRMHEGTLQTVFVDELRASGFEMSIAMFRTLLARARARRKAAGGYASENPAITAPVPASGPTRPATDNLSPPPTVPKFSTPQDIERMLSEDIDLNKL